MRRFVTTEAGAAALVGVGIGLCGMAYAAAFAHGTAFGAALFGTAISGLIAWSEYHHGRRA